MTITDQAFGSIGTYNRYHGSLGTGINLAFVKEVDVKTTAFEPQYGKATGGIVQIVTQVRQQCSITGHWRRTLGRASLYASRYQYYQFGYQQLTPTFDALQPAVRCCGRALAATFLASRTSCSSSARSILRYART